MTDDDRLEFAKLMTGLSLLHNKELATELTEIYFRALSLFSLEDVRKAIDISVLTCTWFPKPAELIKLIEGTPDELAQGAWVQLEEARGKVGYWNSIWIEDAALSQALLDTFGGWLAYCDAMHVVMSYENDRQISGLSPEMQRAKQKEFSVNYARAKKHGRNVTRYHAGRCETENRNSVGGWRRGMFPDGSFYQPVGILAGDTIAIASLPFDLLTGQLTEGARMELESNAVGLLASLGDRKAIEGRPQKLLKPVEEKPPQSQNLITHEQFEAARAEAVKKLQPSTMSDEEFEERRRLSQEQAKKLLDETAS